MPVVCGCRPRGEVCRGVRAARARAEKRAEQRHIKQSNNASIVYARTHAQTHHHHTATRTTTMLHHLRQGVLKHTERHNRPRLREGVEVVGATATATASSSASALALALFTLQVPVPSGQHRRRLRLGVVEVLVVVVVVAVAVVVSGGVSAAWCLSYTVWPVVP